MRIVEQTQQKIKELLSHNLIDEIMWFAIIFFLIIGSFSLGVMYERRSYRADNPITIEYSQEALDLWDTYQNLKNQNTEYFGSQNGSIVYPTGCSKGGRIKEENKIFFVDLEQAIGLGYREVEGC